MVDFEDIQKIAYLNIPLPTYPTQAEQLAYLSMRALYNDYRKRNIQKDQAKKESDMIRRAYEEKMSEEQKTLDLFKRSNEISVKLAGMSKLAETGSCERCKTMMRIFDGRIK